MVNVVGPPVIDFLDGNYSWKLVPTQIPDDAEFALILYIG